MLENLLSWAKSQQNLLEFNPYIHNLANLLQSPVDFSLEIAKSKNIKIVTDFPKNISIVISNAIKFSNTGDVISVGYKDENEQVLVYVKDTGVGISDDNLFKIFDDDSYFTTFGTNQEKGSGLGLKLCKEFVKKNNGKIWVESKLDIGTSFYFTLKKTS